MVVQGDEKGNPKTDADLTKWKEEEALLDCSLLVPPSQKILFGSSL